MQQRPCIQGYLRDQSRMEKWKRAIDWLIKFLWIGLIAAPAGYFVAKYFGDIPGQMIRHFSGF